MNLPQYRRALRQAHEEFAEQMAAIRDKFAEDMREAGDRLEKALMSAHSQFMEDPEERSEHVPERRKEPR